MTTQVLTVKEPRNQWMKNRCREHGTRFEVKRQEALFGMLSVFVLAKDGWFGWINQDDATFIIEDVKE